jgi:hypothetical protein
MTHNIDPTVAGLTLAATKPLVEKGVKKLSEKVSETDQKISEDFDIVSKEIMIQCLEKVQRYSAVLDVKKLPLIKKRIDFKHGKVRRCNIRPINSLAKLESIVLHDTGFTIDFKTLQKGEKYIIDIDYELEDDSFIEALVDRSNPRETPSQDDERFWMVAALKHLDVLKQEYNRMELFDLDFRVNVAIAQQLNTKIPKVFTQQIEQLVKIAGPLGRGEIFREYGKLRALKHREYGANSLELLGKLQELFLPSKFRGFLGFEEDFHYGSSERGVNEYNISLSWPRTMIVISRTDLNLDRPVAKGTLIYKKSAFLEEIDKIFH